MDLNSALTTQGPLQKESPGVFKIFQSRYFAIRGKGQFLVWFKKKPLNPNQDPKGIINIETITQIIGQDEEDRNFSIIYLERTFNLRAQSLSVKQRWITSLKTIINHFQKINKNKVKLPDSSPQSWKWKNTANQSITQQIRQQNEKVILQTQSQMGKKSQQFLAYITKQKSIFQIQKCVVYGFYSKKKMLTSSQRWYFLASGANLKDEKDQDLYNQAQQFLQSLNDPVVETKQSATKQQQKKKKKRYSSSSSEQESQLKIKKQKKQEISKQLRVNALFQYDPETKQLKNVYNIIDVVSFQISTKQQPFQIKIIYEQVINDEEEQIKQNEIILMSNFLVQIKKLYLAFKIIEDKYSMQKQREDKNANKSKRYPVKKWRYVSQDQWRIPQQKSSFYVLLSKKAMRINMLTINLQQIKSHNKQSVKTVITEQNDQSSKQKDSDKQKQKQKKQDVLQIVYKKQEQQIKIYIQFDKLESMNKFMKKLSKNIKKVQQAIQAENASKIVNFSNNQKKTNQDTYLIDKKIRQTNASIKVNFYQMMDRQIIIEKKQENPNKNNGFIAKIMGMFCAGPASFDLST